MGFDRRGVGKDEGCAEGETIKKYSEDLIALGRTSVPEDVAKCVRLVSLVYPLCANSKTRP